MKYKYIRHPSKLVTLMITHGAGRRVEHKTKYPDGTAHYMEHVRFKGTKNYTAKDLLKKVAYNGGAWNAFTSEDIVSYHMTIPEENIEAAFKYLAEVMLGPEFPAEELEKEKEVVCQEIKMYDDDLTVLAYNKLMSMVYTNSLAVPIGGTIESVRSITRDHIQDFNRSFYNFSQMYIALAAPVDYYHFAEKYFGIQDDVLIYPTADKDTEYAAGFCTEIEREGFVQDVAIVSFGGKELREAFEDRATRCRECGSIIGSRAMIARLQVKVSAIGGPLASQFELCPGCKIKSQLNLGRDNGRIA